MEVVVIGMAFVLGLGAARLGLPALVGYLAAGLALSFLGVQSTPLLEQVAQVGVLLLLFTIGLTVNLGGVFRREVAGVGFAHLLLVMPVLAGVLWLMGVGSSAVLLLLLAVALANPSTVLLGKVLEQKRELVSFHGRVAVGVSVLKDLASLGLLILIGVQNPSPWALLLLLLPLLRPLVGWVLNRSGHEELLLLLGIGLALGGAELTRMVGIAPELGALAVGVVLAGHPKVTELSRLLWGLRESFLVAFFLKVGLAGLPSLGGMAMAVGLLALLPFSAALLLWLFVRAGLRSRTSFLAAASLTSYSEFTLVAAAIAQGRGLLASEWEAVFAAAVGLSIVLAAPLNWASHQLYERFETSLQRLERGGAHPDLEPTSLEGAAWLIVGMGRTGGAAYRQLSAQGQQVLGLDSDPEKLKGHQAKGRRVIYGDAEDPELWQNLDLTGLRGILLTMPELEAKRLALPQIRRRGYSGLVAVTSLRREEDAVLEEAGASLIFRPFTEAGERLAQRVLEYDTPTPAQTEGEPTNR